MIKNLKQITDNKKIKVRQIADALNVSRQAVDEVLARDIKDLKVGTLRKYLNVINADLRKELDRLLSKLDLNLAEDTVVGIFKRLIKLNLAELIK